MGYSSANVIGLIEIDTGLSAHLAGDTDDASLGESLARLAGLARGDAERLPEATSRNGRYTTQFLRADVDQLQGELEVAFHKLLTDLFEGK
jgi:hypothetical protein